MSTTSTPAPDTSQLPLSELRQRALAAHDMANRAFNKIETDPRLYSAIEQAQAAGFLAQTLMALEMLETVDWTGEEL